MNTIEESAFFLGLFRGASLDPKENDALIIKGAERIRLLVEDVRIKGCKVGQARSNPISISHWGIFKKGDYTE